MTNDSQYSEVAHTFDRAAEGIAAWLRTKREAEAEETN